MTGMKKHCLFMAALLLAMTGLLKGADELTDPAADYVSRHRNDLRTDAQQHEHVIKIEIDTQRNGQKDIFLSTEKSSLYDENQYENNVYIWDMYRNLGNGRYIRFDRKKGEIDPGVSGFLNGQTTDFDPSKIYVGQIKELNIFGLLAIYYEPKHNALRFSAYVFHGDYFEELNFPDAAQPSGIYHRDGKNNVPDLPDAYKHYLSAPPITVTTLPDTF